MFLCNLVHKYLEGGLREARKRVFSIHELPRRGIFSETEHPVFAFSETQRHSKLGVSPLLFQVVLALYRR
jgi:hypothetical protein